MYKTIEKEEATMASINEAVKQAIKDMIDNQEIEVKVEDDGEIVLAMADDSEEDSDE